MLLVRILIAGAARRWRWIPADVPNERSLHSDVVPRCGGVAVVGLAILGGFDVWQAFPSLLLALVGLLAVSFADDHWQLSATARLFCHLLAAALIVSAFQMQGAMAGAAIVLIVAAINFTNFMDGANGMVGGTMAVAFAFLAAGLGDGTHGVPGFQALSVALVGTLVGFLFFNVRGGRIFLGDSGSVPLGFLAATISLYGYLDQRWTLVFPLLVFLPLFSDATLTLTIRVVRRQRFWAAHREHTYQRLIESGMSHQRVALLYCVATAGCGFLGYALLAQSIDRQFSVLFIAVLGATGLLSLARLHAFRVISTNNNKY
jgi:UDP-N-acetylmuramyl pentapeptide phosphotransferase/UDP-N-acetylglucosamine-1-phosphate transferase